MVSEIHKCELVVFNNMIAGDIDAFNYFFETYYSDLCNFINLFVRNESLSEEIIQDIFIYFWNNKKKIKIHTSVRSYLYTASRNKVLNFIRNEKNRLKMVEQLACREHEPNWQPDQVLQGNELNEIIQKAVEELPQQCQRIFTLSRENGYSNKKISEELNISVKTVENQMTIALKKLREFARLYGF